MKGFLQSLGEPPRGPALIAYALAILALCAVVIVAGFSISAQVNHDTNAFDQGAYVMMAQKMKGAGWPWYNDGTRNPLLPWLTAKFTNPDAPDFFEQAKRFNVVLAGLGTAALGIFFGMRLNPLAAFNVTALSALAVLLPASTFFGAEGLYDVLFLFLWVCAFTLLRRNSIPLYAAFGILLALCYLAKPSTTPFLALFLVFSIAKIALRRFEGSEDNDWRTRRLIPGILLALVVFAGICAPRFEHSQRTWGSAMYSLPEFWFWMDDWDTCVQKYYDCRAVKLATMAPEEQPSASGYFKRHTFSDALNRGLEGTKVRLGQFFHPEGKFQIPYDKHGKPKRVTLPHRGFYLVALFLVALILLPAAWRKLQWTPFLLPIIFSFAVLAAYTATSAWYLPIGNGHRFMLTLYIPTAWLVSVAAQRAFAANPTNFSRILFLGAHTAIAALLVSRIVILLADGTFEKVSYTF